MATAALAALMRDEGMRVEQSNRHQVMTDSNHAIDIAPNLLNRDFTAGDISYVWTHEG